MDRGMQKEVRLASEAAFNLAREYNEGQVLALFEIARQLALVTEELAKHGRKLEETTAAVRTVTTALESLNAKPE